MRTTPEYITELAENERFVFGANLTGRHGRGAARQAMDQFGAQYGVGEGLTGQCYAFPTLDAYFRKLPLDTLREGVSNLIETAEANPHLTFLVTKVGCGLAGFSEGTMIDVFDGVFCEYGIPENIVLPEGWR